MNLIKSVAIVGLMAMLSACSSFGSKSPCGSPGTYMDSETRPGLVVPEGLDAPSAQRRVRIPQGADVVHTELRGQSVMTPEGELRCHDRPPPGRGLTSQ